MNQDIFFNAIILFNIIHIVNYSQLYYNMYVYIKYMNLFYIC